MTGEVTAVDGGFHLRGRYPFVTGCHNATWLFAMAALPREEGGALPMMLFVPRDSVRIEDNWDTLGMRGTGSNDVSFDVHVPAERTSLLSDPPICPEAKLAKLADGVWYVSLVASAVLIGTARRAQEEVERLLSADKKLFLQRSGVRQSGVAQRGWAECGAQLESAHHYARHLLDKLWLGPDEGRRFDIGARAELRAGLAFAAAQAAAVVDQLGDLATSDAMWRGSALERCLRDARMLRMHASVYSSVLERAGKVQLGVTEVDHLL
ncbi:MAG: hypothetical protein ACKV2O_22935 [Acidimicrobiales bacterium]